MKLSIGVPRERKNQEYRIGLLPALVRELIRDGVSVMVESGAGRGSGFDDASFLRAGAIIAGDLDELFDTCRLIIKVKEPNDEELKRTTKDHVFFDFLHLAASKENTKKLLDTGATYLGFETYLSEGTFPLLLPMSQIAGHLAVQIGAHYLLKAQGGRGVLLEGLPGVLPGHVVIVGAGNAGSAAARSAAGLGARTTVMDINIQKLESLAIIEGRDVETLVSLESHIEEILPSADLLIGAALVPGARAPTIFRREHMRLLREGSVFVDIAIDQGGTAETSRPTDHSEPTYVEENVIHYAVTNIPSLVARTATRSLSAHLRRPLDRLIQSLIAGNPIHAIQEDESLASALQIADGTIMHSSVKEAFPDL